jgi:hypothetical protein
MKSPSPIHTGRRNQTVISDVHAPKEEPYAIRPIRLIRLFFHPEQTFAFVAELLQNQRWS